MPSLVLDDNVTVTDDEPSSKRVCQSSQEEHVKEAWTASAGRAKMLFKNCTLHVNRFS